MDVSAIVAMTKGRVIGREGRLPWRLPRDLKHFRRLTMGKPIIMGRKTHESLGRALPGRRNIVLSTRSITTPPEVLVAHSVDEALATAHREGAAEVMVIGGGQVYSAFLERARTIHLTLVAGKFDGDAFFPVDPLGSPDWRLVHEEDWPADADNPLDAQYLVLERRRDA